MNDSLMVRRVRPRYTIVAEGLDRLRGTIPVPAAEDYFAVLTTGSKIRGALVAQAGGMQILKTAADLLASHDLFLSDAVPVFSHEELFEASLGGIFVTTRM